MKKGKAEEGEGGQPSSDKTNGTAATGDAPQSESANETTPEAQIAPSTGQPSGTTTAQKPGEFSVVDVKILCILPNTVSLVLMCTLAFMS